MTNNTEEPQDKPKSNTRGVRSPNYPVVSLAEAVERAQMIWAKEFKHPATRENLAKDIGYGGLNGASASVISALSKYGLLEAAGDDQHKLSDAAIDIILHDEGTPERAQAIQTIAFQPALFTELRATYGDRLDQLPNDRTIEAYLIKRGYNPKTVSGAIRSYRDTIAFVNQETKGSSTKPKEEPLRTPSYAPYTPRANTPPRSNSGSMIQPPKTTPSQELTFRMGEGSEARIFLMGQVTQEAIQKLIKLLELTADTFPTKSALKPTTISQAEYERIFDESLADEPEDFETDEK